MTMTPPRSDATTISNGDTKLPATKLTKQQEEYAIESLQKLVRFPTVSATAVDDGAYVDCAEYLVQELESLGVLSDIHVLKESPHDSPVVVAHWKGQDESLPVILLNSHYDVVPALPEDWSPDTPPFEAVRKDGKIYGRGTQDMKCVCIQYIESLRMLAQQGFQPTRSIYLSFVPDEEVGGSGMAALLDSSLYKSLPGIALALDEGLASTSNQFDVFYGERLPWWIDVTATGPTGHGSRFIDNTAVEQMLELTQKALAFRQGQRDLLFSGNKHENCAHAVVAKKRTTLGDVTSLNITTLQAGVQVADTFAYNCVPPTAKCSMDIRISPHTPPSEISDMLNTWCQECSKHPGSVQWNYIAEIGNDLQEHATTSTDTKVNPWYKVFTSALKDYELNPQVFPAATDSRFLRALGIRALGFSPMRNTEIMLHEHNEYILESNFLEGIGVYQKLIAALASQTKDMDDLCK